MNKQKRKTEFIALENAIISLNLEGHKVFIDYSQNLLSRFYFVDDLGNSLTGSWSYEKINHFIMGYGKAYARFKTNVKIGKITYNQQTPPSTLTYKQIDMADKVAKEIIKIGYDAEVQYDSGTIDILVAMDLDGDKCLNTGRFRVFWAYNGDNKLQYLGVGRGHFDGYEIKREWTCDIEIKEVSSILKKDIAYYNSK